MRNQDSVKDNTRAKQKKAQSKTASPSASKLAPAAAVTKPPTQLKAVSPSRDQIAQLAEKYWIDGGQPEGSAVQDWLRAEKQLISTAS